MTSHDLYRAYTRGTYAHGSRQIRYVSRDRDLCPRFGRGRNVETKSSKRYSRSCEFALEIASRRKPVPARAKVKFTETARGRASTLNGASSDSSTARKILRRQISESRIACLVQSTEGRTRQLIVKKYFRSLKKRFTLIKYHVLIYFKSNCLI